MVTKCPSKYESAEGSLTVKGLLDQQDSMMFKDIKVCGYVKGEINDAQADFRFTIESQGETLKVAYDGGLDEAITDGTALVISGHLDSDGVFVATEQPSIDSSINVTPPHTVLAPRVACASGAHLRARLRARQRIAIPKEIRV